MSNSETELTIDRLEKQIEYLRVENKKLKVMSIETLDIEDIKTLLSIGFRHAEIEGSFHPNDVYDAFNAMKQRRMENIK